MREKPKGDARLLQRGLGAMWNEDRDIDLFLQNNTLHLDALFKSRKWRLLFALSPRLRGLYADYRAAQTPQSQNAALARIIDAIEDKLLYRARAWLSSTREDVRVLRQQWGKRVRLDNSDARVKDYYSVVVIVKNEARYIKEFVLFYQATGADRVYVYDNDSTDNLVEVLQPFVDTGYVVYQKWPGRVVQTAAYRDAIRRTRHRTTWLAMVDADEFLYSPKDSTPKQLKAYERYLGVGVNWIVYGPNGHVSRPDGLVMDNYTSTLEDYNTPLNHHIKSIVQPRRVLCVQNVHFATYKKKGRAVSEDGSVIDNYPAFGRGVGKAFTRNNHHDVFRINHYMTKSLEDLEAKSRRGYPDGSPNRTYEGVAHAFEDHTIEDYSIKTFADMER